MICNICKGEKDGPHAVRTCEGNTEIVIFEELTGEEKKFTSIPYTGDTKLSKCPDCGIVSGGFHHPGCDNEICPNCKEQIISCWCEKIDCWCEDCVKEREERRAEYL